MSTMRIRTIPARTGYCCVCGHVERIVAFDHDLAALNQGIGDVGEQCEQMVRIAEVNLRMHHLAVPTDSLLEGGGPESCCL